MDLTCTATLDNELNREKLVARLKNLGFEAKIAQNTVTVCYSGYNKTKCDMLISVFEEYKRHEITFGKCLIDDGK